MEPAWWIMAPVDSIAAIFPKVSLRSNTVHMPHSSPPGLQDEAGRYVESYTDGPWLLLLISPMVVLKTDWWERWERGGERWREVVFKGASLWRRRVELSSVVETGNISHRSAMSRWMMGWEATAVASTGRCGWNALRCNHSRSLGGGGQLLG